MKEVRIRISEELYNRILERYKGCSVSEAIKDIIQKYMTGLIDFETVKTKVISSKFKTTCLNCGKTVNEGETVLWIKGVGVICRNCIISHIKDKFTDKDYKKLMLKLEVEIERLKTLKSELRKEVKDLIVKYYSLLSQINILESLRKLDEIIDYIEYTLSYIREIGEKHEITSNLKRIEEKLDTIRNEVMNKQIPQSWVEKIVKTLGVKIKQP